MIPVILLCVKVTRSLSVCLRRISLTAKQIFYQESLAEVLPLGIQELEPNKNNNITMSVPGVTYYVVIKVLRKRGIV